MLTQTLKFGHLTAEFVANPVSNQIAYILSPYDAASRWLPAAADHFGINICIIYGMNWDNDLTPWPAPGVPAGTPDFKGLAPEFLATLTSHVLPAVEKKLFPTADIHVSSFNNPRPERSLIGVSLSGLFTMWAWPQTDLFANIATLSGSFWYEGFTAWFDKQTLPGKNGKVYMLLGESEPHSPNRIFATVGTCTAQVLAHLRALAGYPAPEAGQADLDAETGHQDSDAGYTDAETGHPDSGSQTPKPQPADPVKKTETTPKFTVTFQWVPGNHYQDALPRLNLALTHLYAKRTD